MEWLKFAFDLVIETLPKLYDFIKNEVDGGADAEKLRNEPVEVYVAFKGGSGEMHKAQINIESDMLDPNAD
jgi:hypothetical protein